jgi:hypothetical protein
MLVVEDLWLWKAGRYEKRGITVIGRSALCEASHNLGQMKEYLTEFVKAAKVKPPGAVAQLDILGAQLTLDKVLEADATMANDGTNAIEAFRAAMQYPGTELAALQCCQYYPQAQLGLPRAYAMTGRYHYSEEGVSEVFRHLEDRGSGPFAVGGGEEGVFRSPVTSVASFNFLRRCYGANALTVLSHAGLSAKPRTGYLKEFTGIPHLPPPTVPSVKNDARF